MAGIRQLLTQIEPRACNKVSKGNKLASQVSIPPSGRQVLPLTHLTGLGEQSYVEVRMWRAEGEKKADPEPCSQLQLHEWLLGVMQDPLATHQPLKCEGAPPKCSGRTWNPSLV